MKKLVWRKLFVSSISILLCLSMLVSCGAPVANEATNDTTTSGDTAQLENGETPVVTLLRTFNPPPADDHPYVDYVAEQSGVRPSIQSISGDYTEGVQTLFAAGENIPDAFRPLQTGMDETLISQNAALPLDDLLVEYAPDMYENIPEDVWNIMRAATPEEQIYIIPQVYVDYAERGWFIRTDWLDKLDLEVPTTQEELVDVLIAFRDEDPNGNGERDEIPTGAQEGGYWLHGFFAMYGVPFFGPDPLWDIYDGKLKYSAITDNARDAIEFMAVLYDEGLIDPETFLNTSSVWASKIQNDQVGLFYHVLHQADTYFYTNLYAKNPEASVTAIAPPKVDGYDGFITRLQIANLDWMIPKSQEENAANVLTYLNWSETEDGRDFVAYGIEGETWNRNDDGSIEYLVENDTPELFAARYHGLKGLQANDADWFIPNILEIKPDGLGEMLVEAQEITYAASKTIAGDGLPNSVYEGYPDHKSHKLFEEYLVNIVTGEWPIEKFDEFVDEWYASGGTEIEARANEWYERVQNLQS